MQDISERKPPTGSQYFQLTVGSITETFKLPNFAARQELIALCGQVSGDTIAPDLLRAMAATLGACWWGERKTLTVSYFEHRRELIRFGDMVMDELEADGLTGPEILEAGSQCLNRVINSIPTETEVEEQEAFTEATTAA